LIGGRSYSQAGDESYQAWTVGDVNGDGRMDVAIARAGWVGVKLGNGNGTYQSFQYVALENPDAISGLTAGDMNGDGRLDLVVAAVYGDRHRIWILLGNGDGTFQSRPGFDPGDRSPYQLVAADSLDYRNSSHYTINSDKLQEGHRALPGRTDARHRWGPLDDPHPA
jgi:hypothetical protein